MTRKIIAVIVIVIAVAAFWAWPRNSKSDSALPDASQGSTGESAGLPTYTANDVAKHNVKTSCWTIINGSIYNITGYIPSNPAGDDILKSCGADGTRFFTDHKVTKDTMASFKIGVLSD